MEQLIHLVTLAIILITGTVFGVSKFQIEKEINSILYLFKFYINQSTCKLYKQYCLLMIYMQLIIQTNLNLLLITG